MRKKVVGQIADQPLATEQRSLEVAAALEYEQHRRDMLRRLAMRVVMMNDCESQQLGIESVNRYTALKRSGAI